MKRRFLGFFLVVVLAVLFEAPTALAGTVKLYGSGYKSQIEMKDKMGQEFIFYDIMPGATEREDTRDSERFIRAALNAKVPNGWDRSLAGEWDGFLVRYISRAIPERFLEKDFLSWHSPLFADGAYSVGDSSIILRSGDAAKAEQAIREKIAEVSRGAGTKFAGQIQAGHFLPIGGFKELGFAGPSYATVNVGVKELDGVTMILAYGTVFYDFQQIHVEDGQVADSAVGRETDLEKLKGRRGFTMEESNPTPKKSGVVENLNSKPVQQTVVMSEESSTSITNSTETSNSTTTGFMAGTEVESKVKFPLLGETSVKVKAEFNMSWAGTTTNGHSETRAKTERYENSVSLEVPARSRVRVDMMNQPSSYSIGYDFPIGLTCKAAQYVVFSPFPFPELGKSLVVSVFGMGNDADNGTYAQNLRNRFEHMYDEGYEAQYCSGRPIPWKTIPGAGATAYFLSRNIPMSVTGGTLSFSGDSLYIKVSEPVPLLPVSALELSPSDARVLTVSVGGTLDILGNLGVEAMDAGLGGESPMRCHGFDDEKHGDWVLCDERGLEIGHSELAHVEDGGTLVAKKEGTIHLKYLLDEQSFPYAVGETVRNRGAADETTEIVLGYSDNDEIKNNTLIRVDIVGELPPFTGTVTLSGDLALPFGGTVDLSALDVVILDGEGQVVTRRDRALAWLWDGQPVFGKVAATEPGAHRVKAVYGGVESNEATVTVAQPAPPQRIELDRVALTLDKGESAVLRATLKPDDADPRLITWMSSDEKVATVKDGKVFAHSTGRAGITCRAGEVSAVCEVKVETHHPGKALHQGKLALVKGSTFALGAPGGALGTWTVKDENIATVSPKGKVTAVALGGTELVFKVTEAKEGAKFLGKAIYGEDEVTVPLAVRRRGEVVTRVSMAEKKQTIAVGEQRVLLPTLKPAQAVDREVYYQTSDKKKVLVDDAGNIVGVAPGKAVITITAASGKQTKITVVVRDTAASIRLNAKKQKLVVGECFQLQATAVPEIAGFAPLFESKKPSVASVDEDGVITAHKKGKAVIVVYADAAGKIKAKCTVTVK